MKKIATFLLCTALVLCLFTGCGNAAVGTWTLQEGSVTADAAVDTWTLDRATLPDAVVGAWVFDTVTMDGVTYTTEDYANAGQSIDLGFVFDISGSFLLHVQGLSSTGSWTKNAEGSYTATGGGMDYDLTLANGVLTYTDEDGTITMIPDETVTTAVPVEDAQLVFALDGTVKGTVLEGAPMDGAYAVSDGTYTLPDGNTAIVDGALLVLTLPDKSAYNFNAAGSAPQCPGNTVTLNKDGTAAGNLSGADATGTWTQEKDGAITIVLDGVTYPAAIVDGVLTVTYPAGSAGFAKEKA